MHASKLALVAALSGLTAPAFASDVSAQDCWLKAFRASDADAVSMCYAKDAVLYIPSGPTTTGRDAIRKGYADFFANLTVKDVTISETNSAYAGGDKAAWGTFHIIYTDKKTGAESIENGRFTELSRKIDGHWLYVVDHASDEPPMAK